MKRKDFLKRIGLLIPAAVIAPVVVAEVVASVSDSGGVDIYDLKPKATLTHSLPVDEVGQYNKYGDNRLHQIFNCVQRKANTFTLRSHPLRAGDVIHISDKNSVSHTALVSKVETENTFTALPYKARGWGDLRESYLFVTRIGDRLIYGT